jgi:tetratricopeptide (TPR) repeat protein
LIEVYISSQDIVILRHDKMGSIIEGYEYDIFISYRQKDNKYDRWVTEFVDNLKREIEATFKEDVSIYFDENPRDGLLEIHNVDKSLENKLKSLVFIPIISQTYCDTKTFAWQNEFVSFNKMAREDLFGRDIKLASGNVCSRIIPVKIHDLDPSDTEILENEMGCRLRSIDFIYSSAGVNRPLKPTDNPDKNLNKTFYRDQINKVANAVKEVIYGLHPDPRKRATKSYQTSTVPGYSDVQSASITEKPVTQSSFSRKTILLGSLGILLVLAMIFLIPKLSWKTKAVSAKDEIVRQPIAVLPVSNLTGNPDLEYIGDGIQDDLTGRLGIISSLDVRPRSSTLQFKDTRESVQQMAKKLNVNTMIESSIKGSEGNLQIEVGLVQAFPEEKYIWRSSFVQSWDEIADIYSQIVSHIIDGTKIKLTSQEANRLSIVQKHNPDLLKACAKGKYYMNKLTSEDFDRGIKFYNEAMAIDPTDPLPYLGLALGYSTAGHVSAVSSDASQRAIGYARQALDLDSTVAEAADAYVVLATRSLYTDWDFAATERYLKRAMELNPNIPMVHYHYGWFLMLSNNVDGTVTEFKRSIEIDPIDPTYTCNLASLYAWIGQYEDALAYGRKVLELDPNYPMAFWVIGSAYAGKGMYDEAIETCKKGIAISPDFEHGLGVVYALAGQKDKANEVAAKLEKINSYWYTWGIAEIYSALGDYDKAIHWIEEAYKQRHDFTPWFKYNFYFKPLYNDPRFKDIVNRLNLPV